MLNNPQDKRKCVKCGIEIPIKDGVLLIRGATFSCKPCHKQQKHETKDKEVCEFC